MVRSISIRSYSIPKRATTKRASSLETMLTRLSSNNVLHQHSLIRRGDTGKKPGGGNKKPRPPNNPSSPIASSSKLKESQKPKKFEPMTNHVNDRATIPNPLFTPMPPKHVPLGVSKSPPGSPRTPRSPGSPGSPQSPFDRGQSSSFRPQRQRNSQIPEITPAPSSEPQQRPQVPHQREPSSELKKQGSRELPPSGKEIKEWQRNGGLVWDWATRHPGLACAAGAVVLGGCASISGIPLIAYGSAPVAKGLGVGLAMAGPTMATTAGTTVAMVGIGEYKKGEMISKKRQEEKWDEFLEKSRLKKVPSVNQISQSMRPSLEKISSSIKSGGNAALDNLRKLNIGLKRSPTEESLTSPKLDDLTIPENPNQDMAASWSSPASFPARNKPSVPKKTASLQMTVFKKDPPQ